MTKDRENEKLNKFEYRFQEIVDENIGPIIIQRFDFQEQNQ
jgi:hypothetical protein